jgi:hypothetical protein
MGKRFFRCDDNGCDYDFVVDEHQDSVHCELVLRGSGIGSLACDEPGAEPLEWRELTRDQATTIMVNTDDDGPNNRGRLPLAECEPGEWFSSEY